ncbi:hypothetical protein SUGI_0091210 [Cryptomeria japonica]|uniref:uncharacterized protein LOC131026750 n=1 Tax=Cryptomeria japonica TaxID=3369 RepID=UPI002408EB12|nr:uncharacterized protein LOC131026750 [Cryptomeria japonica]GLJ08553.1 hypothetical protein SUGI_0091210 [Cryptomeria japonica]
MALRVSTKGMQITFLQWQKILAQNPYRRWLNNGPDSVEELFERHVEKPKKRKDEDEDLARQRLTSTRREALALYREIFRATRFFVWSNEKGVLWRDILRANARQEFEDARYEKDPEIIARLLVGGRDAVHAAIDKAVEKYKGIVEKQKLDDNTRY